VARRPRSRGNQSEKVTVSYIGLRLLPQPSDVKRYKEDYMELNMQQRLGRSLETARIRGSAVSTVSTKAIVAPGALVVVKDRRDRSGGKMRAVAPCRAPREACSRRSHRVGRRRDWCRQTITHVIRRRDSACLVDGADVMVAAVHSGVRGIEWQWRRPERMCSEAAVRAISWRWWTSCVASMTPDVL